MTRRALCMGTNYVGTSAQLAGCVNDARDWAGVLGERGFTDVIVLVDNDCSRQSMLEAMEEVIRVTGPDDLAVITWSGHGSWQVDRSGDEPDRRDEVICPNDYARAGMIADDDLYTIFTSGHRWARVVFISDSCHSGSVNRFAPPLGEAYHPPRLARFLPPAAWLDEPELPEARAVELAPAKGKPRLSALLLSACEDTEVAYDAWFDGRANGAFTYAAIRALETQPATYRAWHKAIRALLPSVDFQQTPLLTSTSTQSRWPLFEA